MSYGVACMMQGMARYWDGFARTLFIAIALSLTASASAAHARQPNIVVFLADDQGWGDLGVSGNRDARTPNIDSIARDGVSFDRFFVCAVCAPTRAEFLTGRYHPRTGVRGVSTGQERLNLDEKTIAQVFKEAGYVTGAFGKWHNGTQWPYHPRARGFDEYYGFTSGHWGEYFDPPLDHNGAMVRGEGYITDDFTDKAIAFIEANRERPFFCYVPYNVPHSPYAAPATHWERWKDALISMPGGGGKDEDLAVTRCVSAMNESLDWNVGRVLRKLDELKLAEDTIVVYFTDNGPNSNRWNGGMRGRKGSVDEGGVRSPLFVRWPGKLPAGRTVPEIAAAIDLLPTLASLAGFPLRTGKPLDGRDVSGLMKGTPTDWPARTIFSHQAGRVSGRTQQYRLDDRGRLYDMVADPGQAKDVSQDRPDIAETMRRSVAAWRRDVLVERGKDDRPFPVGFREFPITVLPARDGVPHGGVQRSANAPNSSYFVHWTSADDAMTWDIEVNTAVRYEATLYYTCPEKDAGSLVELTLGSAKTSAKVTPGWDPPLYTNQDTIPRPGGESQMKEFRPLKLGVVQLEKGRGLLTLRATEVPGARVMDVRQVVLTLLAE